MISTTLQIIVGVILLGMLGSIIASSLTRCRKCGGWHEDEAEGKSCDGRQR